MASAASDKEVRDLADYPWEKVVAGIGDKYRKEVVGPGVISISEAQVKPR